jgi:hypothetical protein
MLSGDCQSVDRCATDKSIRTFSGIPVRRVHGTNPTFAGLFEILVWRNFSNGSQKGTQSTLGDQLQIVWQQIGRTHTRPSIGVLFHRLVLVIRTIAKQRRFVTRQGSSRTPRSPTAASRKTSFIRISPQSPLCASVCVGSFDLRRNERKNMAADPIPRIT